MQSNFRTYIFLYIIKTYRRSSRSIHFQTLVMYGDVWLIWRLSRIIMMIIGWSADPERELLKKKKKDLKERGRENNTY